MSVVDDGGNTPLNKEQQTIGTIAFGIVVIFMAIITTVLVLSDL